MATGQARYIGEAQTQEKYPFIMVTERNCPAVFDKPGIEGAHHVQGQLWECSEEAG